MADPKKEQKISYESQESLYEKALAKLKADEQIVQHKYRIDNALLAASMFESVGDYLDAPQLAKECRKRADKAREDEKVYIYETACRREKQAVDAGEWEKALEGFEKIRDYRDAAEHEKHCRERVNALRRRGKAIKTAVLSLAGVVLIGAVIGFFTGFFRYVSGIIYMKAGVYASAEGVFEKMPGYLDADKYRQECIYGQIREGRAGDEVPYGDKDWKILAIDGTQYTMIASNIGEDNIFYSAPFSEDAEDKAADGEAGAAWKDSSLRAWLNGEVLETIFTQEERDRLVLQTSAPSENNEYGTAYPDETEDYLTILSVQEAEEYMDQLKSLGNDWWLRTPGHDLQSAAFITARHTIHLYGMNVSEQEMAVRPVIRVDFADLF